MVFRLDGCSESPALRLSHVNFGTIVLTDFVLHNLFLIDFIKEDDDGDLPRNHIINVTEIEFLKMFDCCLICIKTLL